jgi:DNA repair exonuclease SbcCD nuclease subunit
MKIELLGDPHLGRRFKTGVPLHRMGEREDSLWQDLHDSLRQEADMHINMGDLFDKFTVPATVILRAADAYLEAAEDQPGCHFVIIRGNHDVSRDTELISSFDIFKRLVADRSNIQVVDEVTTIGSLGFIPYDPFISAEDQVRQLPEGVTTVYMHHDVVDFGGEHVIPTKLLAERGIFKVVDGHDHLARELVRDGVHIHVTGSMQPYTHAEDPHGKLYWTGTLAELAEINPANLNIRVLLQDGESLPVDLDCLSLTVKRAESEDLSVDTSEFESFDMAQMLAIALDGLSIKDELLEKFNA